MLRPPATGYRNRETGALTVVGENGYAWSSSSNYAGHNNAGHLNFNSGNVNPLNNNPRAYGFPVRCVQHLRLPFQ
ncbi:MAG: fibrobacter succinogenes major paralogous domain-containing protein, partial [Alistipes sp.]|nr:fibrobacter succinogenes major paralogous domain-containing protein [Alistipes sp.]